MGTARNWFNTVRKKFIKSSHQRDIVIPHSENLSQQSMIKEVRYFPNISPSSRSSFQTKNLTREDIAAIKIQSVFRGHLARRAYRALRSLVKLQAVARGAYVRKQVTGQGSRPPTPGQVITFSFAKFPIQQRYVYSFHKIVSNKKNFES
ncbi:hypothetical protein GOBAR_DD26960 [Gossypium barbadense]|nr:hypothetical protein GOBAR_DD26960 [Gossypium barbadense]